MYSAIFMNSGSFLVGEWEMFEHIRTYHIIHEEGDVERAKELDPVGA